MANLTGFLVVTVFILHSLASPILAAAANANATGFWEPAPGFSGKGNQIMTKVTESWAGLGNEAVTQVEMATFLRRVGVFAQKVKIAQTDESISIISDDRHRFSSVISKGQTRGSHSCLLNGYPSIVQRGRNCIVRSTYARVKGKPYLCQALNIKSTHTGESIVIKNIFKCAQATKNLPNAWQEPPSIITEEDRNAGGGSLRTVQSIGKTLFSIGSFAASFL